MAQTKSKIILVVVLALAILLSVLPINALATNTDIVTVKENDNLYYVYVEGLLNQDFEFAFSNSEDATSLNYIVSDKDNSKNSIAYVDEELKANFFNSEDTYIWVKTQDKVIIDGEKIVLDNAKTVEELKTIENITNVITVQANAENEKIKINGEEGVEYYYKVYIAGSSEDYNKFIALVNEVSNYNEKTDFFIFVSCLYIGFSCVWKKANLITLHKTDDITSIEITVGENTVNHTNKTWINEIIADISNS